MRKKLKNLLLFFFIFLTEKTIPTIPTIPKPRRSWLSPLKTIPKTIPSAFSVITKASLIRAVQRTKRRGEFQTRPLQYGAGLEPALTTSYY